YGLGGGLKNVLVAGNTIYNSAAAAIRIEADNHSGTVIENNIAEQHGGYALVDYAGTTGLSGITFRTNLWYGFNAGVGAGTGDVNASPLFVAPGGNDAAG